MSSLLLTVVPDDETFHVKLRRSDSLSYNGACNLEILKDFDRNLFHIAIYTDHDVPRLIVKWQIDHIRQYGSNQSAFKFESGRYVHLCMCVCVCVCVCVCWLETLGACVTDDNMPPQQVTYRSRLVHYGHR